MTRQRSFSFATVPSLAVTLMLALMLSPPAVRAQQATQAEIDGYRALLTLMRSGEFEEVIQQCEEWLTAYPQSAGIPTLMRQMIPYVARHDVTSLRILEYARLLRRGEGETPMAFNNAAWALFEASAHLDTAAVWADIAIAGFPAYDESPAGRNNRGMVLDTVTNIAHARGQTERAIDLQREAVELTGNNPDYMVNLATFLMADERDEEATGIVVDAILRNPRHADGLARFEELAAEGAQSEEALVDWKSAALERGLERSLAGAEEPARVKGELAAVLYELELLPDTAVAYAREALARDPDETALKGILGALLVEQEAWAEAEGYLVEARLLTPRDRRAQAAFDRLAQIRSGGDEDWDAYRDRLFEQGVERILDRVPDNLATRQQIANSLHDMELLPDLTRQLAGEVVDRMTLEAGPDAFVAARVLLAQLEQGSENWEDVLAALEPALPLAAPYEFNFHTTRGAALTALGRTEEALQEYLDAAAVYAHPNIMRPLQELWEETYGAERDLQAALEQLQAELEDWHIEGTFAVPDDWSGRVVLAELFTGSECPPCLGADLAFDNLLLYYPDQVLGLLVYHQHIPAPDPMTNPDSEARRDYYNAEERLIGGVPTAIINGRDVIGGGGGANIARARFQRYSWSIENQLARPAGVEVVVDGRWEGDRLQVIASYQVTDPDLQTSENLRLRIALAEGPIHHEGSNGVSEHPMVVRQMIGGPEGFAIDAGKQRSIVNWIDIGELQAELLDYLTTFETEQGYDFPARRHEIDRDELVLVAFVQDDSTREILQARVLRLR